MAFRMKPNPINQRPTDMDGDEGANSTVPSDNDGDEGVGDISDTGEGAQLSYIKDFVDGLSDQEFGYLQDCIQAKLDAENQPEYKKPEDVKRSMDAEGDARGKTANESSDEDY